MRTRIFPDMLSVCQVRGRDSTGVITVLENQDFDYVKQVGPPNFLLDTRTYISRIENKQSIALVGHCRHKTAGGMDRASAHPFEHGHIVGVHNGTLRNYYSLPAYKSTLVDSDVLFQSISEEGPEETFSNITGAWACVWWDNDEERLKFIRNSERPLYLTWSKDMDTMFWASEPWMFGVVERRIELWDGGKNNRKIYPLDEDVLFSFAIDPKPGKGEQRFVMNSKAIKGKEEVRGNQGNVGAGSGTRMGTGGIVNSRPSTWTTSERNGNVIHVRQQGGSVPRPFGQDAHGELNDEIPPFDASEGQKLLPHLGQPDTTTNPGGSGTTRMADVEFLRNSVKRSDSTTPLTIHENSSKNTLSLPQRNSKDSAQTSKSEPSGDSERQCGNTGFRGPRGKVSIRVVAGIPYINDNVRRIEYSINDFEEKTKATCCFCKTPIGGLEEVSEFIAEDNFICVHCVDDPNAEGVL